MSRIFISYRRGDTSAYAGRIYDRLSERYGDGQVFMDVDAIEPGADFVEYIEDAVGSCDVLIAVIGRDWSTATNPDGGRRLEDPEDFVRLEVAAGLERDVRVIPVLVEGTAMPASTELPGTLAKLARRNALEISDSRWRHDIGLLIETIDKVLGGRAPGSAILEADTGRPPSGAQAPPPPPPGTAPPAPPGHATAPAPSATDYMVDQAKRATISMWLGIASVAIGWIYLGFLPGIPAIILGHRVRQATPVDTTRYRARATAGFWLGIVGCLMSVAITIVVATGSA
jgi:TIR domain-containing protein